MRTFVFIVLLLEQLFGGHCQYNQMNLGNTGPAPQVVQQHLPQTQVFPPELRDPLQNALGEFTPCQIPAGQSLESTGVVISGPCYLAPVKKAIEYVEDENVEVEQGTQDENVEVEQDENVEVEQGTQDENLRV